MKMDEYNRFLEYCDRQYQKSNACNCGKECVNNHRCQEQKSCDCYNCVSWINKFENKKDHYNCHKMAYYYILKHGFRFYPENVILFQDAFCNYYDKNVFVMSIGCGPCTELFGGLQAWRNFGRKDEEFHFHGFDLNPIWEKIDVNHKSLFKNVNVLIDTKDAFGYYKDSDEPIDIVILNYSLSDMFRFNNEKFEYFVKSLLDLIINKKPQYLLINDVYTKQSIKASSEVINSLNERKQIITNQMRRFHSYSSYVGEFGNHIKHISGITNFPHIVGIPDDMVKKYNPFHELDGIQAIIKLKGI